MPLSRVFAVILLGVVVAVAFFVRGELTVSPAAGMAAAASPATQRANITERSLELHAANAVPSSGGWRESITERSLELHAANAAASPGGWRESITERSLELHAANAAASH